VRISWSATDASGVRSYDAAIRRKGGSWVTLATVSRATAISRSLTRGVDYQIRVRATDVRGHRSAWKVTAVRAGSFQESSSAVTYMGTWTRSRSSSYWGGATSHATKSGATATVKATARAIAWVAPVGPTRGSARVYVDGVYVTTVSLRAPAFGAPRVVFQRSWTTAGAHRILIRVNGTAGHPRVDVDGFLIIR
jgi:hypothetical protein